VISISWVGKILRAGRRIAELRSFAIPLDGAPSAGCVRSGQALAGQPRRLSPRESASGYFQAKPEFTREIVDDTNLFHHGVGDVRHGHRQFTGKEHGGQSLPHLAAHLIFNRTTRRSFLALAAMESRAHFADQTFHSCDCEGEIDGECGPKCSIICSLSAGSVSSRNWSITAAE
jgi:hypothetical protein